MAGLASRFSKAVLGSTHTIRGFHHTDWAHYQCLMRDGVSLAELPADADLWSGQSHAERIEVEDTEAWPLGGMWLLENESEILCICRMMVFPTHGQLRCATMGSEQAAPLLIELLVHVLMRCTEQGVDSILIEEDLGEDQARSLACRLGWGYEFQDAQPCLTRPH